MELSFLPTLDRAEAAARLDRLLVGGPLRDPRLSRRIERLADAFQGYAGSYPLPLWAPGLVLTAEMRSLTEALFPISEIRRVFDALLRRGCRFPPLLSWTYLYGSASWLDLLQRLSPQVPSADPAVLLRELAQDPERRCAFLFALFLPPHYGGAFDRYPEQSRWLSGWLRENEERLKGRIRALDSACGSGEGTYGLAESVSQAGFEAAGSEVHGSTLEVFELFAAAHARFPHDPKREAEYRLRVAPLLGSGPALRFYLDEVGSGAGPGDYDVILCNGLLGGPLLHEPGALRRSVASLAARLRTGGVLLAADRFHAGWKLKVPAEKLRALMRDQGLTLLDVPEGVAGALQPSPFPSNSHSRRYPTC